LQGLDFQAATRRGTTHLAETAAWAPPQGLQGLHAPAAQGLQALAAHGLQGLQAFLAAQGLHAPQAAFFAAQGLQAPQAAFFAAQGLQAPQAAFLAAHGLQGLQAAFFAAQAAFFFKAQGLQGLQAAFFAAHGLQAASCRSRGFGLAIGNWPADPVPPAAAKPGALGVATAPAMMPTPTNAVATVVDNNFAFNELTGEPPSVLLSVNVCWSVRLGQGMKISNGAYKVPDGSGGLESTVINNL